MQREWEVVPDKWEARVSWDFQFCAVFLMGACSVGSQRLRKNTGKPSTAVVNEDKKLKQAVKKFGKIRPAPLTLAGDRCSATLRH